MRSAVSSRERGYTLVEMMAVIAVLGILMSILIYGLAQYRRKAFQEGTRGMILTIKAALDGYCSTYGRYPPDGYDSIVKRGKGGSGKVIKGTQCLVMYLCLPTTQEVEVGQDVRTHEHKPFLSDPSLDMLSGEGDLDDRLNNPNTELVDKYGNALHYDNVAPIDEQGTIVVSQQSDSHLESGSSAMVKAPDPREVPGSGGKGKAPAVQAKNKGGYDLWSHGFKIADSSDDITNWK